LVLDSLEDVGKYYSLIDMYLVSSREEGGPKAILESVATNCPIVSSNVGMAPDVFSECNNLVYSEKSEEYVECILRFASSQIEKEKLLGKYKSILKKYGWDNVIVSYIQIRKELGFNDEN
jgi:glycosyltransferase involved in cell wall biosynthesis